MSSTPTPNYSHQHSASTDPSSTASFDAMKRSFELASLSNGSTTNTLLLDNNSILPSTLPGMNGPTGSIIVDATRKRFASSPAVSTSAPGLIDSHPSASTSTGLGFAPPIYPYGGSAAGAIPFIPQAQQQQHLNSQPSYSNTHPSPYAMPQSYAGANYGETGSGTMAVPFAYDATAPAFTGVINPYTTSNPGYPNQFSATNSPAGLPYLGLLPGLMGASTSPTLGFSGAMGGMQNGSETSGRTVYVGNLPADASVDELLSQVRFGPIDSVKVLPEKSCAFISFLDPHTAAAFHSDALMRKIRLHDNELKIGWGKASPVASPVVMAVQQFGATRNVYLGNLPESVTEQSLRDDLSRFGPIDQVKIVRGTTDKNIGFVHFLSIATALKVVQHLPTEPEWIGRRISYGKDRCAYVPKNQHQQQQHNLAAAARGNMAANYGGFPGILGGFPGDLNQMNGDANVGNRTLYLGNVHPQTTIEEICNTIRGGILQQIRYIVDKHICFVTFVDAQCALAFYQSATYQGLALHNRRLKVGWGKHSGPPTPGIQMVVQSGGSRNVYVGNIEDYDLYSEEKLRRDFGEFGEIELVNTLREKQCAFINFTNIANAIKSIEAMKIHPDYAHLKIAYGKDRCGNPPRNLGFAGPPNFQRSPYLDQFTPSDANGSPIAAVNTVKSEPLTAAVEGAADLKGLAIETTVPASVAAAPIKSEE